MTSSSPPPCGDPSEFIAGLISASFQGTGGDSSAPTGRARHFLKKILEHFHAEGIVFWRLEGPNYQDTIESSHRLVSGVSVFKDRVGMPARLEISDLPISETNSGRAFVTNAVVFGREVDSIPSPFPLPCPFHGNPCFLERKIKWLLALPVAAPETGVFGVLSLYWRDDQQEHAIRAWKARDEAHSQPSQAADFFRIAAALWPGVYQRIRESRRLQLIMAVDNILGQLRKNGAADPEGQPALSPIRQDTADDIMAEICEKVGELLHAQEVSIFLSPLASGVPTWTCRASNWHAKPTRIYTPDSMPGITGWCLAHQKPIYIPDLHSFDTDKSWLEAIFEGGLSSQTWGDDLGLGKMDADHAEDGWKKEWPVRSFLAAPLIVEGVLVGAIRCTAKANSPLIYFSNEERTSLEILGRRIAQTWRNWQIAHAKNAEAEAWKRFNEQSKTFPTVLAEAIKQPVPDLSLLKSSILEACRVSLLPWGECTFNEPHSHPSENPVPPGEEIIFRESYKGAKELSPAKGILGMAERQLEAYRTVCNLVHEVQVSTHTLSRALSDLRHQIINPLNKALLRANRHLKYYGHFKHIGDAVYPIRGLLRKSVNVANALHLLVDLEKTEKLKVKPYPLKLRKLYMLLTEVVRDARLDIDPQRELEILLVESFRDEPEPGPNSEAAFPADRPDIKLDFELLEQVLNSIIENAIKYSNGRNTVLVDVNLNEMGLRINVVNRGARLLPEEAPLVTRRNYRSPTAERYSGEGTGIGLYLVKAIANAHGADFDMVPTNEQGYTQAIFFIPTQNQPNEARSP